MALESDASWVFQRVEPGSPFSWAGLLELAGAASQGCGGPETCPCPSLHVEGPSPPLTRHILPHQWACVPPSRASSSHGGQLWKCFCPQQGCWGGKVGPSIISPVPEHPLWPTPAQRTTQNRHVKRWSLRLKLI